ncbi:hypothetical protein [Pseudomonas sp. SCB32]|uniref:hypothetical protein n=1 Tax=Pseudomonas sp. SCB32 TaxID=2653853 RepID=UPI0012646646|nr:hypothetical protein [Pseudomonas sp. SCB32]
MKKLPSSFAIILASDVRLEVDQKFTMTGIFPGTIVIHKNPGESYGLLTLACYAEFYEADGPYSINIQVSIPDSEVLAHAEIPNSDEHKGTMTIAGKFQNIKIEKDGDYNLSITINGKSFTKSFGVELVETESE